ncbi:hypothetical protein LINGRAHAP2_LOCUS19676 [Linum grandiflorum]
MLAAPAAIDLQRDELSAESGNQNRLAKPAAIDLRGLI